MKPPKQVAAVLAALDGYRNPDGGYGWGLEPDLRATESQPGAALHAFEAMADATPATTPNAGALCDWLQSVALPDGGLPFALPISDPAGCAPFWAAGAAIPRRGRRHRARCENLARTPRPLRAASGAVPVDGGAPGETLHLLDFAPYPGRPVRALVTEDAVTADLDRLANLQQPDGGWTVDYASYSPAAAIEWRGYATVRAVLTLQLNHR